MLLFLLFIQLELTFDIKSTHFAAQNVWIFWNWKRRERKKKWPILVNKYSIVSKNGMENSTFDGIRTDLTSFVWVHYPHPLAFYCSSNCNPLESDTPFFIEWKLFEFARNFSAGLSKSSNLSSFFSTISDLVMVNFVIFPMPHDFSKNQSSEKTHKISANSHFLLLVSNFLSRECRRKMVLKVWILLKF